MAGKHDPVGVSEPTGALNGSFWERLPHFRLWVPTYFGQRNCMLGVEENEEFDNPHVPVLLQSADGVRVILGSHNCEDWHAPDIQIERRPKGWAIFLHPSGGDPSGYVYFLDDGRSFLVKEIGGSAIELIDRVEDIPELDDLPARNNSNSTSVLRISASARKDPVAPQEQDERQCGRCGQVVADSGDWYDELCPECADATEGVWICQHCGREANFELMGGHGAADPECCGSPCTRVTPNELDESQ